MDRYQRVEKPKAETPIKANEIRITAQGFIKNYVIYGISLIQDKRAKEITLNGMGQAISKAVAVAEILKKQFPKLHQETAVSSMSLTDVWEPIEEGLIPVETTRQVSMISITLSTKELNKTSPGYQAPKLDDESVSHSQQQQPRQAPASYNAGYGDSYGRDRGRGRGRGRGWGRGYEDYYPDNRGYSNNRGQKHMGRGRNSYQRDNNHIAYDQGYDQGYEGGYDQRRGAQGGGYERSRGGGYELGGRGGRYERGQGSGGYERGRGGGGYERGRGGGGYERGRGGGGYERGRGSGYDNYGGQYEGGHGGGFERSRGDYASGREGVYEQGDYEAGQGAGYERGRGGYARGRGGGYDQGDYGAGQGAGYERGRGGYGRGRGRAGGRSRGVGY